MLRQGGMVVLRARGSKSEFVTAHGTVRPALGQPRGLMMVVFILDVNV